MNDYVNYVSFGMAALIIPACVLLWVLAFERRSHGFPVVRWTPRRPIPWSILDLLVLAVIFVIVIAGTRQVANLVFDIPLTLSDPETMSPKEKLDLLTIFSASELVFLLVSIVYLMWRPNASGTDLGWDRRYVFHDLGVGIAGYVMAIVPMLTLHALMQWLFGDEEKHPFIEMILTDPDPRYLWPILIAATVAAPLTEEFLFRVVLQGWLERLPVFRRSAGSQSPDRDAPSASPPFQTEAEFPQSIEKVSFDGETSGSVEDAINAEVVDTSVVGARTAATDDSWCAQTESEPTQWGPILITGALFGLAHLGQGPAPISLVFLGVALGYIYQRTHRILPCLVLHFLVNLTAVMQLGLYVFAHQGETAGSILEAGLLPIRWLRL